MARDEFVRMDRELIGRLSMAGTVEERERLVNENLRRKEEIIAAEIVSRIMPFRRST